VTFSLVGFPLHGLIEIDQKEGRGVQRNMHWSRSFTTSTTASTRAAAPPAAAAAEKTIEPDY